MNNQYNVTSSQDPANEELAHNKQISIRHCEIVHTQHEQRQVPDSYRSIDDPLYRDPTPSEIAEVIDHLSKVQSKTIVAKQLGLQNKSNQTRSIERWKSGECRIPYPAWRLLLILDGRAVETNRIAEPDGSKPWSKFYGK